MKLDKFTFQVMKNFAKINPSMIIREGSSLLTVSAGRDILAWAAIEDYFPQKCCIYDLPTFLSTLNMFELDKIDITFNKDHVLIEDGEQRAKFQLSSQEIMEDMESKQPSDINDKKFGEVLYKLRLTEDHMKAIIRSASTLSLSEVVISSDGIICQSDVNNNQYSIDINSGSDSDVKRCVEVSKLNFFGGDYEVSVYKDAPVVKFDNVSVGNLYYYIAEKQNGE